MTITLICIQKGIANLNQALIHNGALLDAGCWMHHCSSHSALFHLLLRLPHTTSKRGEKRKKRKTSVGLKLFIFPKGTDLQRKGGQYLYSIDTVSMSIATVVVSSRPVTIIALTLDSAKRNEIQCDRKMFFQ